MQHIFCTLHPVDTPVQCIIFVLSFVYICMYFHVLYLHPASNSWYTKQALDGPTMSLSPLWWVAVPFLVGYCPPFVGLLSHLWWVLSPFCWVPIPPLVGSVPLLVGCCPPFCGLLSPLVGSAPLLVGCCPIFGVLLCPLWWVGDLLAPPLVVGLLLPLISSPTNPPSSSGWKAFQQRKNVHEL